MKCCPTLSQTLNLIKTAFSIIVLTACFSTTWAAPVISSVTPRSIRPAQTTEVTLVGTELTSPLNVWTTFAADVKVLAAAEGTDDSKTAKLAITLTDKSAVGVGGLVVSSATGVSQLFLVMVDDLPATTDGGKNNTAGTAQGVDQPTNIIGTSSGTTHDYYSFQAKAGELISFDVYASRIGSSMDPVLRLLTAVGNELAYADDSDGLNTDCRFRHQFVTAGTYIIEVADSGYKSGQPYALRIGNFPNVTTAFPLGIQQGVEATVGFTGPSRDEAQVSSIYENGNAAGTLMAVSARTANSNASGMALAIAAGGAQAVEQEPNDEFKQATQISLPGGASGLLGQAGDVDLFKFQAEKGKRLRFRGYSRSLGSPAIVKYRVLKVDGTQLAAAAVTDEDEFVLSWIAPETGEYLLEAVDLLRRGGNNFGYLITAEQGNSFSLSLKNDKATKNKYLVDAKLGAISFPVTVVRDGYDGPITITTTNDIAGLQWHRNVIAKGANAATVIVRFPSDIKAGALVNFHIVGEAEIDGQLVQIPLMSREWIRTQFTMMSHPPSYLNRLFQYATVETVAEFFEPAFTPAVAYVPRGSKTTTLTMITKSKLEAFKGAMVPFYGDISEGMTVAGKDNKGTHTITVTVAEDLTSEQAKEKSFTVHAFAEHAGRGQMVSRKVAIEVIDPVTVSLELAAAIAVGQSQKMKVVIVRGPGSKAAAVTVAVQGLPENVTVPKELTIAADKSEIEVEIKAAANAEIAATQDVLVIAKTKYAGKDVQANSNKIVVQIKAAE
ncbi:MAG: hypothetical protein HOB29_00735 [Planctomycetaceae bacterium]|nr:hypothetical protein [Planctomycetaceae bacterium]MBT5125896.1 hypothetical protein [Planctomycetaceae bacterium]MBT5883368.1 hypothetical protein [Planctomycetaceae bacterium]